MLGIKYPEWVSRSIVRGEAACRNPVCPAQVEAGADATLLGTWANEQLHSSGCRGQCRCSGGLCPRPVRPGLRPGLCGQSVRLPQDEFLRAVPVGDCLLLRSDAHCRLPGREICGVQRCLRAAAGDCFPVAGVAVAGSKSICMVADCMVAE